MAGVGHLDDLQVLDQIVEPVELAVAPAAPAGTPREIVNRLQTEIAKIARSPEVSEQLNQAKLALREAENSRDALKRQLAGEDPVVLPYDSSSSALSSVSVPEIDGRIEAQKKALDGMLQKYTEQHPDVVGTRKVIEQLEAQKTQEIQARRKAGPGNLASINTNPVFQQMKMSLAEAEANVASLRARVSEYETRYQTLGAASRMVPQLETEFTQLNRDYEINKKNYDALVARRESAT